MIKRVYIQPHVRKKMQAYIDNCPNEISGLGTVEVENGQVIITDIFLIKQEVGPGSTVLDPTSLAEFMVEAHNKGIDMGKIKWWWHSHVNMACNWSMTDDDNINGLRPKDFFISTVGNKLGKERTRIDIYNPLRVFMDNVPLIDVPTEEDIALDEATKAEIKEKVSLAPPTYQFFSKGMGKRGKKGKKGKGTKMVTAGEPDPEEIYSVADYRGFAAGMGMSLQALLIQEGKCIFGDYVIDHFGDDVF